MTGHRNTSSAALVLLLLLSVPRVAAAQATATVLRPDDPLWNGVLIGGAAGVAGFVLSPVLFCGGYDDSECTAIVRLAIGLPAIAGGLIAGGVIDKLVERRPVWQNRSGTRTLRVQSVVGPGRGGVRIRFDFK